MASAFAAFYAASAMMLASAFGRVIFPLGKYRRDANHRGGERRANQLFAPANSSET